MISANVRSRAVLAQERAHERRNFHRLEQKAAERDDQTYKKLIRAYDRVIEKQAQAEVEGDKETAAILATASDTALAELGMLPEAAPESAAPPIVDVAAATGIEGSEPRADHAPADGPAEAQPAEHGGEPDHDPDPAAGANGDAVAAVPAVAHQEAPQPARIVHTHLNISKPEIASDDLAHRVYAVLDAERAGSVSSLEWVKLLQRTKLSPARLKRGLDALESTGRIKRVREAEAGTRTYLLSSVAEAAA